MSQSSVPSQIGPSPSTGRRVPFYRKLPRTHLYWFGLTLLASLALFAFIFVEVWKKQGTQAFAMLTSFPGQAAGMIFFW